MRKSLLFTLACVVVFSLPISVNAWYGNYQYRFNVTVDSSNVYDSLTGYPIYLDGSVFDSYVWNSTQLDGDDIVFVSIDDSSVLKHEKVLFDPNNKNAEFWVGADVNDSSNYTFWVYFGDQSSSDTSDCALWTDLGYVLVYHFNDSAVDSSCSGNNGTSHSESYVNANLVGNSAKFSGAEYISGSITGAPTGMNSRSAELFFNQTSGAVCGLTPYGTANAGQAFSFFSDATKIYGDTWSTGKVQIPTTSNNAWYYITQQYNGSYRWGNVGSGGNNFSLGFYVSDSSSSTVGTNFEIARNLGSNYCSMVMTEYRLTNTTINDLWHKTTYYNLISPTTFAYNSSVQVNSQINYSIVVNSFNASAYELSRQNFGIIFTFNNTIINNITSDFNYNGTLYNETNSSTVTSGDITNVTYNYTYFLTPLSIWNNNTALNHYWSYTLQYANNTNYTINITNTQNLWYAYTLDNVNVSNVYIQENKSFWLYANYTNLTDVATLNLTITYNNTNYTGFSQNITAPEVNADTNITYNAWFNVSYNGNQRITNLSAQQKVFTVNICSCGTCSNDVFLNITSVYRGNSTPTQTDLQVYVWSAAFNTSNIFFYNQTSFEVCATPVWANLTVNANILHGGGNTTLALRQNYLRSVIMDNTTYNLTVRGIYDSLADQLQISVLDDNGEEANDRIIVAKRAYVPNNSYITDDMCITDSNGVCYVQLLTNDFYRFDVQNGTSGALEWTTDKAQISSSDITNGYVIKMLGAGQIDYFLYVSDAAVALTFNNDTNMTALSVISLSGYDLTVQMGITKKSFNNDQVIHYNTVTGSNIILYSLINDTNNTAYSISYNVTWPNGYTINFEPLELSFTTPTSFGSTGLFVAFLLVYVFATMKTGSVWAIVFGSVGFVLAGLLNFVNLNGEAGVLTIGFIFIGLVILYAAKRGET